MPRKVERITEAWWYILIAEKDAKPEEQSRFRLKPLAGSERAAVLDDRSWVQRNTDGSLTVVPRGVQQARNLCLSHIVDVENFPVGEPQPWPEEIEARDKYLDQLDDLNVYEIGNEIRTRSTLGGAEKNS